MKLFTSSQNANRNAIQNATIELSEQELSAVTGGCCPSNHCGGPQDPGFPVFPGFPGGHFEEGGFDGEAIGFIIPLPRPCHPHRHHCCHY